MMNRPLRRLLGTVGRDAGCDATFEIMDQYADALLRGDDVTVKYADLLTHLQNCAACREDTEGLLAALKQIDSPPPER